MTRVSVLGFQNLAMTHFIGRKSVGVITTEHSSSCHCASHLRRTGWEGQGKHLERARPAVLQQGKWHSAKVTAITRGSQLQLGQHSKFQVGLKYAIKKKKFKGNPGLKVNQDYGSAGGYLVSSA